MVSPYTSKGKNYDSVECDLNTSKTSDDSSCSGGFSYPCRIVPGQNPLAKHKFYFDLKNRLAANKLETQIKELGGTVELFLVKEVTHLITDNETWYKNRATQGAPNKPRSGFDDSLTNDATIGSRKSARPKTRADAMLERARCQLTSVISDPLDDARKWGIEIWPVEKAFAWLDKITIHVLAHKKKVKVFELRKPYIKFEAFDRKTRPVFKEIRDWPTLNLDGAPGEPAFVCRSNPERNMTRKTRVNHQRNDTLQPGYCEVCRVEYNQLGKHLLSDKHQKFINDNANFISLDTLIDDGANIESFLKLHSSDIKERMCDSDSEYCPPLTRKRMPMNRANSLYDKPKSLPLSPTGSETGGHRLRSRGHVNYVLNTPTEDDELLKAESHTEPRELRSSARLSKLNDHITENDQTWESGRPKRSCITKKRISSDDRALLEKRAFYKVEVMLNRLRSSTIREPEIIKRPETPVEQIVDDKGLIVKFRRIRNSELTYLNNEAENFLFPRKEESSDEDDEDADTDCPNTTATSGRHDSTLLLSSEADEPARRRRNKSEENHSGLRRNKSEDDSNSGLRRQKKVDYRTGKIKVEEEDCACAAAISKRRQTTTVNCRKRIKVEEDGMDDDRCSPKRNNRMGKFKVEDEASMDSNCSDGSISRKRRRRTHAEAFIMDNQKYYKFETPGSRLRYQGSFLSPIGVKVSPPSKNNGDCTTTASDCKEKELGHLDDVKIKLSDLQFSFERVPQEEPWYEAFRRQDNGEVCYTSLNDPELSREFLLPYQLGPLPPLDPRICVSAYKLKKKLMESSTPSTSTADSAAASSTETSAATDTDTKQPDIPNIDIQSELLKIIEDQKPARRKARKRPLPGGRHPRKSPRQHASTLAILSSLVHHRKKRELNRSRVGGSDLDASGQSLPAIPEEKEEVANYAAIENDLEKMLARMEEGAAKEDGLEMCDGTDGVGISFKSDAIEALETYEEVKYVMTYPRIVKRTLRSPGRKPGRKKKKKNRTGWPNRNKRNNLRKEPNTKDEDDGRSVDSLTDDADESRPDTTENKRPTDACADAVSTACAASDGDRVHVDLDKWESAEKALSAKLATAAEFQPYVRVQKLDHEVVVRHRRLRSGSSPRRGEAKRVAARRNAPSSPRSPRTLRKPRGRWYRER